MTRLVYSLALAVVSSGAVAEAGQRRFAYSYETVTSPPGEVEYEQWVTWKAHKANESGYHKWEFRHELEFGLTERLQLGVYLADWEIVDSESESGAEYKKSAVELICAMSDPSADPLGSALYFEAGLGPEVAVLEGKLLLQKNIGRFSAIYNFTLEAEWEGDGYHEELGEIKNTLGVVYQVNPSLSFGIEGLHEVELEEWSEAGDHVFYLGPNISYRKGDFFAVLSPLFQISDVSGEPDFATRLIFGFQF